jgi:hypothetical protein
VSYSDEYRDIHCPRCRAAAPVTDLELDPGIRSAHSAEPTRQDFKGVADCPEGHGTFTGHLFLRASQAQA